MDIVLSTVMGFCTGVRKAVTLLERALEEGSRLNLPVYTIGPLIHNEQYLESVEKRGVRIIASPQEAEPGIAVVRAHGIPPSLHESFIRSGFMLYDGTCSRVMRSQRLVEKYTQRGWTVLIAGNRDHGEVQSIIGYAEKTELVHVLDSPEELSHIHTGAEVLLLAQTTFPHYRYSEIRQELRTYLEELGISILEVVDSICPATKLRQDALSDLLTRVDGVVIVGGKGSANTRVLYERAVQKGFKAWHISSSSEVTDAMREISRIGITAGASTPEWVIDEVVELLQSEVRRGNA